MAKLAVLDKAGKKVSDIELADSIFAINDDMTINYVGFVGHVAYQAADKIGNKPLVKIDYRDIMNGTE